MNMHALRVMIGCTAVCRAAPIDNPACLQTGFCVPQLPALLASMHMLILLAG